MKFQQNTRQFSSRKLLLNNNFMDFPGFPFICRFFKFSFSEHLFNAYDTELSHLIKPIVLDICKTREGNIENYDKVENNVATKLFELYLQLKDFSDRGMKKYGNCELKIGRYYEWFTANVNKWNMVSVFTAKTRYDKK